MIEQARCVSVRMLGLRNMIGRTLHFASRWGSSLGSLGVRRMLRPIRRTSQQLCRAPALQLEVRQKEPVAWGPSVTFTIASAGSAVKGTWKGAAASKAQEDLRPFVGIAYNDASGPVNVGAVLPEDDFLFLHPEGPAAWSGSVKMKRDAGTLQMRGSCNHIQYSGNFTFDPNPEYARQANTLLTPARRFDWASSR